MADKNNQYDMTVSIELDDGSTMECNVLRIYPCNGKQYIAIMPIEDENADEPRVFIYGYAKDEATGAPEILNIEDDDEFDAAIDALDELFDEDEFKNAAPED